MHGLRPPNLRDLPHRLHGFGGQGSLAPAPTIRPVSCLLFASRVGPTTALIPPIVWQGIVGLSFRVRRRPARPASWTQPGATRCPVGTPGSGTFVGAQQSGRPTSPAAGRRCAQLTRSSSAPTPSTAPKARDCADRVQPAIVDDRLARLAATQGPAMDMVWTHTWRHLAMSGVNLIG